MNVFNKIKYITLLIKIVDKDTLIDYLLVYLPINIEFLYTKQQIITVR
jgi:hypothetical protein